MAWNVSSSKVTVNKQYRTLESAIAAFERASKRAGLPKPLHYPPRCAGDTGERSLTLQRWQGPRDGHGIVYVEKS